MTTTSVMSTDDTVGDRIPLIEFPDTNIASIDDDEAVDKESPARPHRSTNLFFVSG